MKKILFGFLFLLLLVGPVFAGFCSNCGQKLGEGVKFCAGCGVKLVADSDKNNADKPSAKPKAEPAKKTGKTYRAKTEVFVYEKRGDEQNILKKNLFFKPRRFKLARNAHFEILEEVDRACLIQSVPDAGEKVIKGWVMQSELLERTDWEKK